MRDLPQRFGLLADALNAEHVQREEEIQAALWALVGGTTLFLLGEPGIAKSMLARRIAARIEGGRFFDVDLDRFSTPEDLFGPRSLEALKDNRWERDTTATLVDADWAFIDEFFEGSSALLKSMLRALRERTFRNGTDIVKMPLTTVIVASNDVPTEARLMPLFDRLVIRRRLSRVSGNDAFLQMLSLEVDENPEPILSWDDVLEAQAQARQLSVPEKVLVAINDVRKQLADRNIMPSDRRFMEALRVIRAAAWLDGGTVEPVHVRCLADICWAHPDQIPEVNEVIEAVVEPLASEADLLLREAVAILRQVNPNLDNNDRERLAVELHRKIRNVEQARNDLVEQSNPQNRQQRTKLTKLDRAIRATSVAILRDLFGMDGAEVEKALGQ